jgi:hypothetical protein
MIPTLLGQSLNVSALLPLSLAPSTHVGILSWPLGRDRVALLDVASEILFESFLLDPAQIAVPARPWQDHGADQPSGVE